MLYVNALLTSLMPLVVCLLLSRALGRGRLEGRYLFVAVTLLGALGGVLFALFAAETVQGWTARALGEAALLHWIPYTDAFTEELGKSLILFVLLWSRVPRSPIDGLLLGLGAGTGFAAVENLGYSTVSYAWGGWDAFWNTASIRIPTSLIIHGVTTAVVGVGLADARRDRRRLVRLAAFPTLLIVVSFMHGGWNVLVVDAVVGRNWSSALGAAGLLAAMTTLAVALTAYGLATEKRRRTVPPNGRAT